MQSNPELQMGVDELHERDLLAENRKQPLSDSFLAQPRIDAFAAQLNIFFVME